MTGDIERFGIGGLQREADGRIIVFAAPDASRPDDLEVVGSVEPDPNQWRAYLTRDGTEPQNLGLFPDQKSAVEHIFDQL